MEILYALLFTGVISKIKFNPRKIKKEIRFLVKVVTELIEMIHIVIRFIFVSMSSIIKKNLYNKKSIKNTKKVENDKIIDLNEYKLKKAK